MFVRIKTIYSCGRPYQYLHIVENYRDNGKVRQRIIGSLGRLDILQEKGDLKRIITQLAEQCPSVRIMRAQQAGNMTIECDALWGPVIVFNRLWEDLGIKELLQRVTKRRRISYDFERMAFALTLQRLLEPGSDLQGSKWIKTVYEPGFERLKLMHFYRASGLLWQKKEHIEESLYQRDRDLFNQELDVVFFDTTSTYFEGTSLTGWARLGKSKDHRPDHVQLVLGMVMRRDGMPIACEIWPGNTADVKTLVPIVKKLRKRFQLKKVILVCDRGMVSKANLKAIRAAGYDYIVGMKMRRLIEVRDQVLARTGRYQEVKDNLSVKEVWVQKRRYIICLNQEEAKKDRLDRESILEKLRKKIQSGNVKKLIGNRGYRRFLKTQKAVVMIDPNRVKEDERYDGKYVLRTTTRLLAADVAHAYKELSGIERLWRELKDVVEVRPIYHHLIKNNVKGHIFSCFLALYMVASLKKKLKEHHLHIPWDEILRDLSAVRAVVVRLKQDRYLMRTPLKGHAGKLFQIVGAKVPPLAQPLP
jgi:transposase